jgi:hypothetical protein
VRRFFLLFFSQNHEFRAVRAAGELGGMVSRSRADVRSRIRNKTPEINFEKFEKSEVAHILQLQLLQILEKPLILVHATYIEYFSTYPKK